MSKALDLLSIFESTMPEKEKQENFKRWFRRSKVVDSKGKPLVVYHGTRADFDTFKVPVGGAHFGTSDQASDRIFNKGHVMPVYLSIQKFIRLPDLNIWSASSIAPELLKKGHITQKEALKIKSAGSRTLAWEQLKNILASKGVDGFIYANEQEGVGDSYIIFEPTQVKSKYNLGTFSTSDPNIMH